MTGLTVLIKAMPSVDHNRKTERVMIHEEVSMRSPVSCVGRTVDIGAGGIGLEIPLEVPVGSVLEMTIFEGHLVVQGQARWVRPVEKGFRVGVQFVEEDWSIIERVQKMRQNA